MYRRLKDDDIEDLLARIENGDISEDNQDMGDLNEMDFQPGTIRSRLGFESRESMYVCKCIVFFRPGGNVNSRRAASPHVRLVEREERPHAVRLAENVLEDEAIQCRGWFF
ncbi:hypothetical protein TNCV_1909851 [Trichonephila clavipes]|nr:hypothetical protein TNCV_1909851 [Trichonephila clavipes]